MEVFAVVFFLFLMCVFCEILPREAKGGFGKSHEG